MTKKDWAFKLFANHLLYAVFQLSQFMIMLDQLIKPFQKSVGGHLLIFQRRNRARRASQNPAAAH